MKRTRVAWKQRGGVATITIDGAADGGYLGGRAAQDLCSVIEDIGLADGAAVVLLQSRGVQFCRGGDHGAETPDWSRAIDALDQPLIALVEGDALDEGAELALAADLRVVSRGARFRWSQLGSGRLPSFGATQRLPRQVGRSRALEILLSGRWVSAAEGARIGLVDRLLPPTTVRRAATALARDLAAKGPLALRFAKEAVGKGSDMTVDQGVRLEQDLYVLLQTTEDRAEGVRSFLKKRRPIFRGK